MSKALKVGWPVAWAVGDGHVVGVVVSIKNGRLECTTKEGGTVTLERDETLPPF